MTKVREITISGFRGVLAPLTLDFTEGKECRSMVIIGRNASGKSSVTDAWEWFATGKIKHLAREGAEESSYRHREAKKGGVFVEVKLDESESGELKAEFDFDRITKPKYSPGIEVFRETISHPCHIRYEDLTEFVYFKKADRFDELANLMGLTTQIEAQKAFKTVEEKLSRELEIKREGCESIRLELKDHLGKDDVDANSIVNAANEIFEKYKVKPAEGVEGIDPSLRALVYTIEKDPRTAELSALKSALASLEQTRVNTEIFGDLDEYVVVIGGYLRKGIQLLEPMKLKLFEAGIELLKYKLSAGEDITTCPLCGNKYGDKLLDHINDEYLELTEVRAALEDLEKKRREVETKVRAVKGICDNLSRIDTEFGDKGYSWWDQNASYQAREFERACDNLNLVYEFKPGLFKLEDLDAFRENVASVINKGSTFEKTRGDSYALVVNRVSVLSEDKAREGLVNDYKWVDKGNTLYRTWIERKDSLMLFEKKYTEFIRIINDYTEACKCDIQQKFDLISGDVEAYFAILESNTPGLSKPALKLLEDQDRAVVLEVVFYGKPTSPAYRYLSSSQLNSFGLSVFLASVKCFNPGFRFIILDDVINSFDAHKRPYVTELLKKKFPEYQFLILTHDDIWFERLSRAFPEWKKMRFKRWEFGSGPICDIGLCGLDKVEKSIQDGDASSAGQAMGPYMEMELQEIAEAFQVLLTYNRRNEYTLEPLLTRLRSRVEEKLGVEHDLCISIRELEEDSGFRNFCAHFKNPSSPITVDEMEEVVKKWNRITSLVFCQFDGCGSVLTYDRRNRFICTCGKTVLKKAPKPPAHRTN